jgi:hypothetical protein
MRGLVTAGQDFESEWAAYLKDERHQLSSNMIAHDAATTHDDDHDHADRTAGSARRGGGGGGVMMMRGGVCKFSNFVSYCGTLFSRESPRVVHRRI